MPMFLIALLFYMDGNPRPVDMKDVVLMAPAKVLANSGEYFILDRRERSLFVFNRQGFSHTIGQYGSGPGEFQVPQSFCLAKKEVLVFDKAKGTLSTFKRSGEFQSVIPLELSEQERFYGGDLAFFSGKLILAMNKGATLAYIFDRQGNRLEGIPRTDDLYPENISLNLELNRWDEHLYVFSRFDGSLGRLNLQSKRLENPTRFKFSTVEHHLERMAEETPKPGAPRELKSHNIFFPLQLDGSNPTAISKLKIKETGRYQSATLIDGTWIPGVRKFNLKDGVSFIKVLDRETIIITREGDLYLMGGKHD